MRASSDGVAKVYIAMTGFFPNRYENVFQGKARRVLSTPILGMPSRSLGKEGQGAHRAVLFNPPVNLAHEEKWDEWLLSPFPFVSLFWYYIT